jgi:hypothetical protein
MLLWCFDVVNNVEQHAEGTIFTPLSHKPHLFAELLGRIVIRLLIVTPKERLSDKVKCIGTAAEAAVDGQEVVNLCNHSNSGVVVSRVVKYKVTQLSAINTKLLQRLVNNLSYPYACMGTCKLRKRNRQICKLARGAHKVRNNA